MGGIIPQKEKDITEDDIVGMLEDTIKAKTGEKALEDMNLDELDELEDEEEERILLEMRKQRIAEIKALQQKSRFGDVREISANDYVEQVNKAGEGIWVILHLYKQVQTVSQVAKSCLLIFGAYKTIQISIKNYMK